MDERKFFFCGNDYDGYYIFNTKEEALEWAETSVDNNSQEMYEAIFLGNIKVKAILEI